MHDLDRTMFETGQGGEFESAAEAPTLEQEDFLNVLGSILGGGQEVHAVPELHEALGSEMAGETPEMELALELLEVTNEQELDRFIADLVSRAAGSVRDFARSPTGAALGGIVKNAVGQALPVVGRAVGTWVDPKYGDVGGRLGKAAGSLLGLELEGLSHEDREFEAARALVRWANDACRRAVAMRSAGPPAATAKAAATAAAQRLAPGLVPVIRSFPIRPVGSGTPSSETGRWIRRGNSVVLLGI